MGYDVDVEVGEEYCYVVGDCCVGEVCEVGFYV